MTAEKLRKEVETFLFEVHKDGVKTFIGDSTNNNRNLTINQLIRFMSNNPNEEYQNLGDKLRIVRKVLLVTMRNSRAMYGLARSDSFDVSELRLALFDLQNDPVLNTILRDNQ